MRVSSMACFSTCVARAYRAAGGRAFRSPVHRTGRAKYCGSPAATAGTSRRACRHSRVRACQRHRNRLLERIRECLAIQSGIQAGFRYLTDSGCRATVNHAFSVLPLPDAGNVGNRVRAATVLAILGQLDRLSCGLYLIERLLRRFNFRQMINRPLIHRAEGNLQGFSQLSYRILDRNW
jgi:hypothetical protein